MARPATVFSWATGAGAFVSSMIANGLRSLGNVPGTTVLAESVNTALNEIGTWITYLGELCPATGEIAVDTITADPGLTVTSEGDVTITAGNGGGPSTIRLDSTAGTGGDIQLDADTVTVDGNLELGDGPVAVGPDDFRYRYPAASPAVIAYDVSPVGGGYTLFQASAGGGSSDLFVYINSGFRVRNSSGGALDVNATRPLEFIGANPEASGVMYQATALVSTWNAAGTAANLQLVQREVIAPYTETVLLEVNGTNDQDNNGGTPIDLDTSNYTYFMRFYNASLAAGSNTNGIEFAQIVLNKFAVE